MDTRLLFPVQGWPDDDDDAIFMRMIRIVMGKMKLAAISDLLTVFFCKITAHTLATLHTPLVANFLPVLAPSQRAWWDF